MTQPPYRDARRVFWIMDNGSSHRGQPCVRRLTEAYPNLVPVHGPVHASWLNQIEIYFCFRQLDLAHFDALIWPTPWSIDRRSVKLFSAAVSD